MRSGKKSSFDGFVSNWFAVWMNVSRLSGHFRAEIAGTVGKSCSRLVMEAGGFSVGVERNCHDDGQKLYQNLSCQSTSLSCQVCQVCWLLVSLAALFHTSSRKCPRHVVESLTGCLVCVRVPLLPSIPAPVQDRPQYTEVDRGSITGPPDRKRLILPHPPLRPLP